jgi:hypothetical protein
VGASCSGTIYVVILAGVSSVFGGEEDREDAEEEPNMELDVLPLLGIDEFDEEKSEELIGVGD